MLVKGTQVMKALRRMARAKGVDLDEIEGDNHTKPLFDGHRVTVVPAKRDQRAHRPQHHQRSRVLGGGLTMATYHAVATRSDNWWAIEVPEHPGVFTQARRIDQVPAHVADALSLWLDSDVSPDDIEVEIDAGDFSAAAEAVRAARERVERARADATTMMSEAVAQGVAAGLPLVPPGR